MLTAVRETDRRRIGYIAEAPVVSCGNTSISAVFPHHHRCRAIARSPIFAGHRVTLETAARVHRAIPRVGEYEHARPASLCHCKLLEAREFRLIQHFQLDRPSLQRRSKPAKS